MLILKLQSNQKIIFDDGQKKIKIGVAEKSEKQSAKIFIEAPESVTVTRENIVYEE